jgi:hypothetical protein
MENVGAVMPYHHHDVSIINESHQLKNKIRKIFQNFLIY